MTVQGTMTARPQDATGPEHPPAATAVPSAPSAISSAGEVPFEIEEIFFSRTDGRGRIISGNDVFQRVSQYAWAEMIDRPHNIIRHPDMPRAVFYVLWDFIRAGRPVGAYVKNRARDGRHYWVYAVVTPVEDGYLSVRLKPSSALFPAASRLYAAVRAHEHDSDPKPADSAKSMLGRLREAGFRDYTAFMATALAAEMKARDAALGRPVWPALGHFEALAASAGILVATTSRMLDLVSSFRYTPSNLRIQAARRGDEGRAIAEISTNYGRISDSIVANLQELHAAADEVATSVNDGLFLTCTARFQEETARFFENEAAASAENRAEEATRLLRQTEDCRTLADEKFDLIKTRIGRFFDLTGDMKRLVSALVAVRVMGKVESVGLYDGIFAELIGDLERGQHSLSSGLAEIWTINTRISDDLEQLDGRR